MDKYVYFVDRSTKRNCLRLIICLYFVVLIGECLITEEEFKAIFKRDVGNTSTEILVDNATINVNNEGNNNTTVNKSTLNINNSSINNNTINNNNTNINNTIQNNNTLKHQAAPFLVVFSIKTVWPINDKVLEKDIASAFTHVVLTQNFINVTVYIRNKTCLWSCPRRKRAADNNTVIFNPTYGNNTTPAWTTATTIKYNNYNSAQGSVLESSAVQVIFAMFEGRVGERVPIDATIVSGIFKFYNSYNELNVQLESVDEVLSFPIPYAEFLASTNPPPIPPNPATSLLIPPWAIFLLVFVGFIIVLFIIWIIYSCMTGTLKEGGAALLIEDYQDSHEYTDKGPLSHKYDINLHKAEARPTPPPLVAPVAKPPRTIRFDRSTSYDVGLLASSESDKNKDNYVPLYKRRESRVQEGAAKRKINQKKQSNTELENNLPAYTPKFARLNSTEKQPLKPLPSIKEIPASPNNSLRRHRGTGNESNSLSEQSDVNDHFLKISRDKMKNNSDDDVSSHKQRKPKKRKERAPDNTSIRSGSYITDPTYFNPYLYPAPISPYPIFQPLQTTYPYPMPPIFANHPYMNPNPALMYPNQFPHVSNSNASFSPKPSQSLNGDAEETAQNEKYKRMAKEIVEEAFDDSGFSTTSFSNRNGSIEKPTDMEEFRKVLDEAFAFSKPKSAPSV